MKKKLLITMGCSFTEGIGAYPYPHESEDIANFVSEASKNPEWIKNKNFSALSPALIKEVHNLNLKYADSFHENGWPVHLQKKINYDKLINIGKGGAANSACVKLFIENFADSNLSEEYDVLVLWLTTDPSRFSFYQNGSITSLLPNMQNGEKKRHALFEAYSSFVYDTILDSTLDTIFFIRTMKEICDGKGYKFLYASLSGYNSAQFVHSFFPMKESLIPYYVDLPNNHIVPNLKSDMYGSPICGHPNKNGYQYMADSIFSILQKHFPDYINTNVVEEITWEYLGKPKKWYEVSNEYPNKIDWPPVVKKIYNGRT